MLANCYVLRFKPELMYITSCKNFISSEHTTSTILKGKGGLKTYDRIVMTTSPREVILKIFLKFRKFQPLYSCKIHCYKKECIIGKFLLDI